MPTEIFEPGEVIWLRQRRWRVDRTYTTRGIVRLDLSGRGERRTLLLPFERPERLAATDRPRWVRPQHARARLAAIVARACAATAPATMLHARLTILPFQLEPVLAILDGARRVLLADEVGLGKTLQAALIIAEVLARNPIARVLVLTPASLLRQWADELLSRFGLASQIASRERLETAAREVTAGENPWRAPGVWLTSPDFVKQSHVLAALPPEPWDVVVIDEAHAFTGESDRHSCARDLARQTRRLLLLTATPHSGDEARFERLIALGQLASEDTLTVFRRTRKTLGLASPRRVRWIRIGLTAAEKAVLDALDSFEWTTLRAAGRDRAATAQLLLAVFRKRSLSTLASLSASIDRRRAWLDGRADGNAGSAFQGRLAFDDDDVSAADWTGLTAETGLDPGRERRWLQRLRTLTLAARPDDSKIRRLRRLLLRSREPVVIFSEFRDSIDALYVQFNSIRRLAVVHGAQTPAEFTRELRAFLDGPADVLLATDVAGQGLNLHTRARWVVNLELPWNPLRLEQRAGRVDRLGQTRTPHVTALVARHPAEWEILRRLAHRTFAARAGVGDDAVLLTPPLPDENAVRRAVIGGGAFPTSPPAARVTLCRRWIRPARRLGRDLIRRRQLARRRDLSVSERGRPMRPRGRGGFAALTGPARSLLVFAVPVVDESGAVLETRIVSLAAPSMPLVDTKPLIDAGRHRARQVMLARAARLAHRRRLVVAREVTLERQLAAIDETSPAVQPGLFDQRAVRVGEAAAAAAAARSRAASARIAELEAATRVTVGRPSLVLIAPAASR